MTEGSLLWGRLLGAPVVTLEDILAVYPRLYQAAGLWGSKNLVFLRDVIYEPKIRKKLD